MNEVINIINVFFTAIFVIESILKIIAFDLNYFKRKWNLFDFLIAFGSIIGVCLEYAGKINNISAATAMRSVRLLKLIKLFKVNPSLKIISETFLITLPALANVGGLLLLFVYIFAILSMNVFGDVMISDVLTPNMNF
jgi:hypothetical protein